MRLASLLAMWVIALVVTSCRPASQTPLQQAMSGLKPGMNRTNIDNLFAQFKIIEGKLEDRVLPGSTILFRTNLARLKLVAYTNKERGFFVLWEYCDVYFDTNDIVVGYRYLRE
jgi:hypothetical protein